MFSAAVDTPVDEGIGCGTVMMVKEGKDSKMRES